MNCLKIIVVTASLVFVAVLSGCQRAATPSEDGAVGQSDGVVEGVILYDPELSYGSYKPKPNDIIISRSHYVDRMQGFWLGQSIANWTGLVTEMDKIAPPFYTDEHWGRQDQKNIWGNLASHSELIDFYFVNKGSPWGSDDDTDIEYMYQHLLDVNNTSILTGEQIRDGWLKHIYSNENGPSPDLDDPNYPDKRQNYLWVSNETAYYLMKEGMVPPATSDPENNKHHMMIDAQLTTEIFGLFAPARPDIALTMAHLPIRTSAQGDAEYIAEFYVAMYSLASAVDTQLPIREQLNWMAMRARSMIPSSSYASKMFDYIEASYHQNSDKSNWELTRDQVYSHFQMSSDSGYKYSDPFDAGINFAASLVSLFYGEGDLLKTIKIGTLAGWDSDNPTATWGGLLGFMLGKEKVAQAFNQTNLSDTYWIHRTRKNFPDYTLNEEGEDTFTMMAERALYIVDRVVLEEMNGGIDLENGQWFIPRP